MIAYADTSFLFSLYLPDANSGIAASVVERLAPAILLSPIAELELTNALQSRVFRREITAREAEEAWARILEHIESEFLVLCPMPPTVYERSRQMSLRWTAKVGARSLDVLHVAIASLLKPDIFLTFDARQRRLARLEGLRVGRT